MMKLYLVVLLGLLLLPNSGCDLIGEDTDENSTPDILIDGPSDIDTSDVQLAPFSIEKGQIKGSILELELSYSGGCRDHAFDFYSTPAIIETNPPGTLSYLIHDGNGDPCRAIVTTTVQFDLSPVRIEHRTAVMINLHKNLNDSVTAHFRYEY